MTTALQALNEQMRKKRLQPTSPQAAPDIEALRRKTADYAKKGDIERLDERIAELTDALDEKVNNLLTAIKSTVSSIRASMEESNQETAAELRKEYTSRLKKLEQDTSFMENSLNKVRSYTDKLPKVLNFPVQRSVSIPVTVDEGGTGQTNNNTFHLGGRPDVDGTWRFSISGTDLIAERRESGVWVQKGGFTA